MMARRSAEIYPEKPIRYRVDGLRLAVRVPSGSTVSVHGRLLRARRASGGPGVVRLALRLRRPAAMQLRVAGMVRLRAKLRLQVTPPTYSPGLCFGCPHDGLAYGRTVRLVLKAPRGP